MQVAYISSVVPAQLLPSDLLIDSAKPEFRSTGLKIVSVLRLHKLATIHSSNLVRHLGQVELSQRPAIATRLQALLAI